MFILVAPWKGDTKIDNAIYINRTNYVLLVTSYVTCCIFNCKIFREGKGGERGWGTLSLATPLIRNIEKKRNKKIEPINNISKKNWKRCVVVMSHSSFTVISILCTHVIYTYLGFIYVGKMWIT